MPNQWLKPVLTYKYPTLALPSYLIIYWLRQERFYDRQHNALMWATRVSNSSLTTSLLMYADLPWSVKSTSSQIATWPGRADALNAWRISWSSCSLFFVHVVCSVKFNRPNQATTNDKSVGQLGTPSFDQLVQFI